MIWKIYGYDMESWTWFIFYLEKIWSSELRQFFIQKKFEALDLEIFFVGLKLMALILVYVHLSHLQHDAIKAVIQPYTETNEDGSGHQRYI